MLDLITCNSIDRFPSGDHCGLVCFDFTLIYCIVQGDLKRTGDTEKGGGLDLCLTTGMP